MSVGEANGRAIAAVLASDPRLVAIRPAGEVVPGLASDLILHAAPPAAFEEHCALLRATLAGASILEGLADSPAEAEALLAAGAIELGAAQDHAATAGGAGAITTSTPVVVVEDSATGARAFHFLMEGLGRSLVAGVVADDVLERLRWLRDEAAPALDAALQAGGGIDCGEIMSEALRRGDELHNRNAAATSLLAERVARGFVLAGVERSIQERVLDFMSRTPQFFVAVSLAASRLALSAGHGIEGSSLVTAAGANGRRCGIMVSGLGDRWFTAPAERPVGPLPEGLEQSEVAPACGDSLVVECAGLGASLLVGAPALWAPLGLGEAGARKIFHDAARIAVGEHPRYRVPALGDRGAPAGIDLLRVVETGVRPVIDIAMMHREPGRGVVGLGLTSLPMSCFEEAAAAFRERYS